MVAFILVSVSMSMPILGSVYKWNHPVFALLGLTYFAQHNVFKAYPCGRVSELLPFYPLHAFATCYLFVHQLMDMGCFHLLAFANNATLDIVVQVLSLCF